MLPDETMTVSDYTSPSTKAGHSLVDIAEELGCFVTDLEFALQMDHHDPLKEFRSQFCYPKLKDIPGVDPAVVNPDDEIIYFCSHSLGLPPVKVKSNLDLFVDSWAKLGVIGHENGPVPFAHCDEPCIKPSARLVGALPSEVAITNGLTVNIHLAMVSFYQPTPTRNKIVLEAKSFPSDHYAVESQIRFHGYDPATSMVLLEPREGEQGLRTHDIVKFIEEHADSIALLFLPGVQYYTGQVFDMEVITKAANDKEVCIGWDLAHAAGNVEISLHDWGADFACWCTYKYMNSGPGAVAGLFIHEKHHNNHSLPRFVGWWGHNPETRFNMDNVLDLSPGAAGYIISNPPPALTLCLQASLEIFDRATMPALRKKSVLMTAYMEFLLTQYFSKETAGDDSPSVTIATPSDPGCRGNMLCLMFSGADLTYIQTEMTRLGMVVDVRMPNVMRISTNPLINKFQEIYSFIHNLKTILKPTNSC